MLAPMLLTLIIFVCSIISSLKYIEKLVQPIENIVLVTSVIHTVSTPLQFAHGDNQQHTRSLFTHEERLKQTVKTIESLVKKIPNVVIVVLEGSVLTEEEQQILYDAGCKMIYNVYEDLKDVINSPYKSYSEITMMLHFLKSKWFFENRSRFITFSKMSGRYALTDNFSFEKYPVSNVVAQCENRCNTRYYRIPIDMIDEFIGILESARSDPDFANFKTEIEDFNIYARFKNQQRVTIVRKPDILGIGGFIAPYKQNIEDFANY